MTAEELQEIERDAKEELTHGGAEGFYSKVILDLLTALRPTWTKEPPTKLGWYWARVAQPLTDAGSTMVVEVLHPHLTGALHASVPGWDAGADLQDFDLWAGPLEAPPLPEGE